MNLGKQLHMATRRASDDRSLTLDRFSVARESRMKLSGRRGRAIQGCKDDVVIHWLEHCMLVRGDSFDSRRVLCLHHKGGMINARKRDGLHTQKGIGFDPEGLFEPDCDIG